MVATTTSGYATARGGLPGQTDLTTDRSRFTTAYAVLPARTMTDIVRALGTPVVSALEGGYDLDGLGLCAEQHVLGLL